MLVSTVTAINSGRCGRSNRASRAADSMRRPPDAWTFSIHTPSPAAARHAAATVLGMSWNLRSRKTSKPRAASARTSSGPAAVNSSLPTFTRHSAGSSLSTSAIAEAASA